MKILILILSLFSLRAFGAADEWRIEWKAEGKVKASGKVSWNRQSVESRDLLFFATPSPVAGISAAKFIGSDESTNLVITPVKNERYLDLSASQGRVEFTGPKGKLLLDYKISKPRKSLRVDKSCRELKLKILSLTSDAPAFPALITCRKENSEIKDLVFSSTSDSEWYGSGIFEMQGKGERWKVFALKDLLGQPEWKISWGGGGSKNEAVIVVPKPSAKAIPQTAKFRFGAGMQYLTGALKRTGREGNLSGFQIPLKISYQRTGGWWSLGSSYDLFFFSLAGSKRNSLAVLDAWGGAEFGETFIFKTRLGYTSRSLDSSSVGISTNTEAPRVAFEMNLIDDKVLYGLAISRAQTATQGDYSETTIQIFWQKALLWKQETRFWISRNEFSAAAGDLKVRAQWYSLGAGLDF